MEKEIYASHRYSPHLSSIEKFYPPRNQWEVINLFQVRSSTIGKGGGGGWRENREIVRLRKTIIVDHVIVV